MRSFSFQALLSRLVSLGIEKAQVNGNEDADTKPTSIRLDPEVRRFIRAQAEALNTSEQSVIGMILRGVVEMSTDQTSGDLRAIRERLLLLFQLHGLDLPSTAYLLKDFGISLSNLGDQNRLLDLISPDVVNYLSGLFKVRRSWISGSSDSPIEFDSNLRWYKNVYRMASKLLEYKQQGLKPHVMFIRQCNANFEQAYLDNDNGKANEEPVGVIVRLTHEYPGDITFKTYECWEFERWNYWRCREQIKLLICFCDQASKKHVVSYGGYSLSSAAIRTLSSQLGLPVVIAKEIHQSSWSPEDYASLRFEVNCEKKEWEGIKETYIKSKLDSLLDASIEL